MPANIQGLNVIQPQQADSQSQYLLSADIAAQLDLWTNLSFDADESSLSRPKNNEKIDGKNVEEKEEDTQSPESHSEKAVHDGHDNVVMATNLGSNISQPPSGLPAFDLNSLLSGFNPYANLSQTNPGVAPSLAQLLTFHAQDFLPPVPIPPTSAPAPSAAPASIPVPADETPSKRSRTRKSSVSSPETLTADGQAMAIAAAEDKRRRTASARFRLKKKEREAALEGKAKELEARVNELERECEGLRRENGWLKGLVVGVTGAAQGVTGAAQGPVVNSPPPSLSPSQLGNLTSVAALGK